MPQHWTIKPACVPQPAEGPHADPRPRLELLAEQRVLQFERIVEFSLQGEQAI